MSQSSFSTTFPDVRAILPHSFSQFIEINHHPLLKTYPCLSQLISRISRLVFSNGQEMQIKSKVFAQKMQEYHVVPEGDQPHEQIIGVVACRVLRSSSVETIVHLKSTKEIDANSLPLEELSADDHHDQHFASKPRGANLPQSGQAPFTENVWNKLAAHYVTFSLKQTCFPLEQKWHSQQTPLYSLERINNSESSWEYFNEGQIPMLSDEGKMEVLRIVLAQQNYRIMENMKHSVISKITATELKNQVFIPMMEHTSDLMDERPFYVASLDDIFLGRDGICAKSDEDVLFLVTKKDTKSGVRVECKFAFVQSTLHKLNSWNRISPQEVIAQQQELKQVLDEITIFRMCSDEEGRNVSIEMLLEEGDIMPTKKFQAKIMAAVKGRKRKRSQDNTVHFSLQLENQDRQIYISTRHFRVAHLLREIERLHIPSNYITFVKEDETTHHDLNVDCKFMHRYIENHPNKRIRLRLVTEESE